MRALRTRKHADHGKAPSAVLGFINKTQSKKEKEFKNPYINPIYFKLFGIILAP